MMFTLPDVRKPETGYKKYLAIFDLKYPRKQEESHFQSYYFYTKILQIRISILFLTCVLFIGTMVSYIRPLNISYLPYYDSANIYFFNIVQEYTSTSPSSTPTTSSSIEYTMKDGHIGDDHYIPYLPNKSRDMFILRMVTIGYLLAYFLFTFTLQFKRLWKLFNTVTLFLVSCIVLIFESDIRTIPGRMILLFIIISISSGMTFLPTIIASGGLCIFYFFYFLFYSKSNGKAFVLISLILLVCWIFLMLMSRFKEQLFRDKFRTLENLKIQTLRSEKIINQMLPAVVVQRLRLQSTKDQSLETTFETNNQINLLKKDEESGVTSGGNGGKQKQVISTPVNNRKNESNQLAVVDPQSPSSLLPGQYVGGSVSGGNNELIVDSYDPVTVLFCEIVNFNALVEKMSSTQVINLLNEVYNSFDRLTDVYGVTKVEHIGNVYMVVGGCPDRCDDHAQRVAHMSLGMLSVIRRFGIVQVRIGMHTGPVVGGIIGKKKLSWHLFGDTINTSSRMASHSSIGKIQVSHPVQQLLRPYFLFEDRGKIQIKGKGLMRTFYLVKTKQLDKRYTSIFSSLHREKPYIPPVDISEVSWDSQNKSNTPDEPTTSSTTPASSIPNRFSSEMNPIGIGSVKRERKGSIFANVMPPKVLNFLQAVSLHSGSSSNNNNNNEEASGSQQMVSPRLSHSNSTGSLNYLATSPTAATTTTTATLSTTPLEKKKQTVQFGSISKASGGSISKGSGGGSIRSPSPSQLMFNGGMMDMEDTITMEDEMNSPIPLTESNINLGKGIDGSNVITSNNAKLNKLEKDLSKHYTLNKFKLSFISRDNLVEIEYNNEYLLKNWNKIIFSMLMVTVLFGLTGIYDYFFLKLSAISQIVKVVPDPWEESSETSSQELIENSRKDENDIYDNITGVRYGLVIASIIFIYVVSKFRNFPKLKKYIQEIAMGFYIFIAAMIIILSSIPPLNYLPMETLVLSVMMMLFTISFNFSGIKFWYSIVVCGSCVLFIEVSKAWKDSSRDIMLSHSYYLITVVLINVATSYFEELFNRQNWVHGRLLDKDQRETESLVSEILPADIIKSMKSGRQLVVDEFKQVTIFLSDIVGFTEMAARMTPRQLVETLNEIYSTFDEIAAEFGVLKVATIGDAYLCVSGCPEKDRTDHATRVANMAIKMLESIKSIRTVDNIPIRMRIGIHTGPVIAGVVGIKMIHYQLWGESCQITQQLESSGRADMIHVSEDTYNELKSKYIFEERPPGIIKNRKIKTYFLIRALTDADPQPEIRTRSVSVSKPNFGGVLKFQNLTSAPILPISEIDEEDQNSNRGDNEVLEEEEGEVEEESLSSYSDEDEEIKHYLSNSKNNNNNDGEE